MKREDKIFLFRDRPDYVKKITDDDLFNITGEKGSGKSFFGENLDNNSFYVVHLDSVFIPEGSSFHKESDDVKKMLIKKYGNDLEPERFFCEKYYSDIVNFSLKFGRPVYIEGGNFSDILDVSVIAGTVIVKRTSVIKCFFRVLKRDYKNEYFMKQSIKKYGRLGKLYRFRDVFKRRIKIFKSYHKIEDFIKRLELY